VWLLGNLFRTEKRLRRALGCAVEVLRDHTDVMESSTENYGILRGAILVAAELSDFFPNSEPRQKAHLKQRLFDVCSSL
jgi:hypothetical protein